MKQTHDTPSEQLAKISQSYLEYKEELKTSHSITVPLANFLIKLEEILGFTHERVSN